MRIHKEMTFIKYKDGRITFRPEDGPERTFNILEDGIHHFAVEVFKKVSMMTPGEVYDLEVTEGLLTEVIKKSNKYQQLENMEFRKKFLGYKMKKGSLTDMEFLEACDIGLDKVKRDYSWILIGVSSIFFNFIFDPTVALTLFTGLCFSKIIWGKTEA